MVLLVGITLFAAVTATISCRFVPKDEAPASRTRDTLREVAILHADRVLTDAEYATEETKLLGADPGPHHHVVWSDLGG